MIQLIINFRVMFLPGQDILENLALWVQVGLFACSSLGMFFELFRSKGVDRGRHLAIFFSLVMLMDLMMPVMNGYDATRAAAEQNGVRFTCGSYEELLNDSRVEAVAIGDYYGRRGELAIRALKAGKHVIADKPLCTSLTELQEIKKLAK